jgi:hypothetical protein
VTGPVRITVEGARALPIAADHWPASRRPSVIDENTAFGDALLGFLTRAAPIIY